MGQCQSFAAERGLSSLPGTADDVIFDGLSTLDLIHVSETCREAYRRVCSYYIRAHNIDRRLGTFFNADDINVFKNLQESLAIVIGGSFALQFFDRTVYQGSGLDLYLELRNTAALGEWLEDIGYVFVPRPHQHPTFGESWLDAVPQARGSYSSLLATFGFSRVFNFKNSSTNTSIVVTASLSCPLSLILTSHSTCVMNVITHRAAYALYPVSTFVDRCSVIMGTLEHSHEPSRAKYESRGWTMIHLPSPSDYRRNLPEFKLKERSLGDAACWTIPISSTFSSVEPTRSSTWGHHFTKSVILGANVNFRTNILHELRFSSIAAYNAIDSENSIQ